MVTKLHDNLEGGSIATQFEVITGSASGLSLTFRAGLLARGDTITSFPDTIVTVADDDTSFVYINTNTLAIEDALVVPDEDYVILASVLAASGVITTVTDYRTRSSGIVDSG